MTPNFFLLLLVELAALALAITGVVSLWRAKALHAQASKLGLQFSHPDRFLLGRRVAAQLPVVGASEVSVRDVAYRKTAAGLACIMTARFTIGTVGRRRHLRRVVAALDPGGEGLLHFRMLDGKVTPGAYAEAHEGLSGVA